jgi:hypothetical protein
MAPAGARRFGLSSTAVKLLVGGLLLREAFSFWTGHPFDFEVWVRTGYVVAQGKNPYLSFWPPAPGVSFAYLSSNLTPAAYLPFWSALLGLLYRSWESVGGGNRFVLYFFLKQPGIWADVGSAFLIYRLVDRWTGRPAAALGALSFWSFFPYSITITAIWGQFDSIVVLVVLGLLYARTAVERNLLYGLGIFAKWITAIYLPLEILRERGSRRLGFVIALAVPALLTVLVFAVAGWSLGSLTAGGVSQTKGGGLGMNYAYLLSLPAVVQVLAPIPDAYTVASLLWVPGVVIAGAVAARYVRPPSPESEVRALLLVLTVFLLLRFGLYEQYFLYPFALLLVDVVAFHPGRRGLFMFTYALAGIWLLINNDLGLRFLSPISSGIQPYTASLDANGTWGVFRSDALLVLCVIVTVTLIQLLRALAHNEERPVPWVLALFARIGLTLRRHRPS